MKMTMPSQFVEGAAAAASDAVDQIDRRAEELHGELSNQAHDAINTAKPALNRWAQDAESVARRGIDSAREAAHQLRERGERATDSTVNYIKDEPVKAMLIAAAAGAALVTLVSLLSRSRHH